MKFVVIGAGGQARELRWYIGRMGHECVGFVVTDPASLGATDSIDAVFGDESWLVRNRGRYDALALGIGTPKHRVAVGERVRLALPDVPWPPVIDPTAVCDRDVVTLGAGTMVGAGATITVGVRLDDFAMVNFGATIGHEARLGKGSVINPNASVSGGVGLGERVLVGAGAIILQYLDVGDDATIGAGAVVTRRVAARETVVGVPARPRAPT